MAESVARVKIQATADLKGFDDATKALKDLQRAVGPTDAALEQARKEVLDFAAANKRSEAVIQAQLAAFQKLRQQAEMGGKVYNDLGRDIEKLKQVVSSSTGALTKLGQAVNSAGRSTSGQSVWQQQSKELAAFNRQTVQTGKALGELAGSFGIRFEKTSQALQEASRQISILKQNASSIGALGQGPAAGGGVFEIGRKGMRDIGAFSTLVKGLKEQSETATGKVARLSEGLFALGATGAAVGQVTSALGGVAGAAERVSSFGANLSATFAQMGASTPAWSGGIKAGLNQIALALNQPASGIAEWSQSLAGVQAKLTMLNGPLEAFTNGLAAIGPEGAAAAGVMAVAFAGLQDGITRAFRAGEKEASEALQGITNETQQLLQKLSQLSEAFRSAASMRELQALRAGAAARFNETPAGTDASRRAANTIANAEARIKAEGQAQANVLEEARKKYRGTSESVDALSERLAYLQSAMKLVDQSTTEGKAEFAAFSSEAGRVKKQIDDLSQSYRTVADAIRDAAAAQGQYANQSTTANYFNRAAARRQEEIAQAAREALARPQMGLLPAAGQTSFAGTRTEAGLGGGAKFFGSGGYIAEPYSIGRERLGGGAIATYRTAQRTEGEIDAVARQAKRDVDAVSDSLQKAQRETEELQKEINDTLRNLGRFVEVANKLDIVNPNSINALKQRRDQIDKERNSVDMLSKEYRELSRELAKIEGKIERTQVGGLRGKVGYIGQGIGAAASAGIFGGPEGLLGGLGGGAIGALLGGPAGFAAGAFTGSSIGAYAGMGRQQVGGFATYAADISKQEIALKGITKTQEEYAKALAASAAATRDFNVPQLEATRGITQLSAAVIGAGGKVADAEVVFRNVTAAIKASGGTSEDVQGALTALGQIFSKGKVSAEELQGQLGERLPGAVTMFAKATGRTLPQLQKDLEQGVVGLADLMKFVVSEQGLGQFEQGARRVASSSADAGARLTATWNDTRRAIGEALLPLGAEIQDSLGNALRDATPALVELAKALAGTVKLLVDNAGAIAAVAKVILGISTVAAAGFGFVKAAALVGTVTTAVTQLGGAMGVATLATRGLSAAMLGIPGIGWIGAAVVGMGLLTKAVYDNNDTFKNWVDNIGGVVANDFKAAINVMKEDAKSAFDFIGDLLPDYENKSAASQANVSNGWTATFASIRDGALGFVTDIQKAFAGLFDMLPPWARKFLIDNAAGTGGGLAVRVANYVKDASGRAVAKGARSDSYVTGTEYMGPGGSPKSSLPEDVLTRWETQQKGKEDAAKKAADKAAADAERLAAEQRRLAELNADQQLQLADAVFKRQVELDRKRFELNRELIELQRQNYIDSLTGPRKEIAQAVMDLKRSLDALDQRRMEAQQAVKQAEQEASAAAQRAVVYQGATATQGGMMSGRYIQGGIGPRGANQYGPHFDIKRSDGGYYSRNALDPYVRVNGRPLSSGTTVPGGEYGAPRSYGGHAGWDYAFGGSAALTLAGGAKWMGSQKGAYGDAAAFMTPDGKVYKIIHGRFEGATAKGQVAAAGRDIKADTSAAIAAGNVGLQRNIADVVETNARAQETEFRLRFTQNLTKGIDEQTAAIKRNSASQKLRNQLQYQGIRPEMIDMQVRLAEIDEERAEKIAQLTTELQNGEITWATYKEGVDGLTTSYDNLKVATEAATMAQLAPGAALSERIGQLRQEIAQLANFENMLISISQTMEAEIGNAISASVTSLVTGAGSIKQTLAEMFRNIGQSFIQMATQIIAKQLVMITLQSILRALGGASAFSPLNNTQATNFSFNPGAMTGGMPWKFATGGVMTSQGPRPLPIKRYATGGIANGPQMAMFGERGPEAYVPLPDGRTIPVKIKESQRANAMDRYRRVPGSTAAVGPDGQPIAGGTAMAGAASSIDVRYTVERINNVEYVTAEQFREGMRSAALEGATRGEQQTLRRLQNAPSARKRVGI